MPSKSLGKGAVPVTPGAPVMPLLGQGTLPSAQAGSFVNQQIGQLNAGLTAPGRLSPTQVALGNAVKKQSAVQLSANKRMDSVKASNARLSTLAQQVAQKRAAAAQAAGGGSASGSMAGVGRAYQNNGSLSASRNAVLQKASSYLGSRYVLGGTSYQGIDCSGLVKMVYGMLGSGNWSHSAGWQRSNIPGVRTSIANLRPGDIVAWKDGSHIAIYAGNGQIIEAANERVGTVRRNLWASESAVIGIALRLPGE